MIKSLKYVATFNSTGRTLKNQISFAPGFTIIKGGNEAGKSFVLEMIRYALFGSDALRGTRKDFDKLEVRLVIDVKKKEYIIERKGSTATINKTLAVGTSAVNKKVKEIIGFDLSVFDIACNVMQKRLSYLTEGLGPTQRRKIIDEVTGLTQFEQAEKDCRARALEYKKIAEALEAQLVEPVKPEKPNDYEVSSVLKGKLDDALRRSTLQGSLREVVQPTKPYGDDTSILHEDLRSQQLSDLTRLQERLSKLSDTEPRFSLSDLSRFEDALHQRARGPVPTGYGLQVLLSWREDHRLLQHIRQQPSITCPRCSHNFRPDVESPEEPRLSVAEIDAEIARERAWEGHTFSQELADTEVPVSLGEISTLRSEIEKSNERDVITRQIEDLGEPMEDRSEEARLWREYHEQSELYTAYLEKKAEIDKYPEPEPFLEERYEMALRYETLYATYKETKRIYDEQKEKLEENKDAHVDFKAGSEAMKSARMEIKRYLIPSLAKVSSELIHKMTNGQRRKVEIDEKFEITVDNQPVNTLSGSGVSVANLAIRIALGKVLTRSVLPIFLADEIDADMDKDRAKATFDSLEMLKSELTQIIVVTHKDLQGDNEICL